MSASRTYGRWLVLCALVVVPRILHAQQQYPQEQYPQQQQYPQEQYPQQQQYPQEQYPQQQQYPQYGEPDPNAGAYSEGTAVTSGEGEQVAAHEEQDSFQARVFVGAGIGMRTLRFPAIGGDSLVDLGIYPALDVGAELAFRLGDSLWLAPLASYQSSIGHEVNEKHINGPDEPLGVRSHHFEGAVAPQLRWDDGMVLGLALGYGTRNLRPKVHHLLTPSYSLSGPFLRPFLKLLLGDSGASLWLCPELSLILDVGQDLRDEGVGGSGFGLGGEAQLEIAIDQHFGVLLSYREAHALLDAGTSSASDIERYVTARFVGTL